ncbi:MAG: c-type cytochrome [Gammaproteobacteria bacterium]|nr:c-type cytochrome [Gammaproteobacteria bacterium]
MPRLLPISRSVWYCSVLLLLLVIVVCVIHADTDVSEPTENDILDAMEAETSTESLGEVAEVSVPEVEISSVEAGRALSAPCTACHGTDGNTLTPANSNLAGQGEKYLYQQLLHIQSGKREIAVMVGQLTKFDKQDLRNIAAYYASLPGRIGQSKEEGLEQGESIYRGGIPDKQVAACTACHAPNGNGNMLAGFPRLSGQPVEYTIAQLKAYREQERTTDEEFGNMMRDIAAKLTDSEIEAVANYMTGLY